MPIATVLLRIQRLPAMSRSDSLTLHASFNFDFLSTPATLFPRLGIIAISAFYISRHRRNSLEGVTWTMISVNCAKTFRKRFSTSSLVLVTVDRLPEKLRLWVVNYNAGFTYFLLQEVFIKSKSRT